MMLGGDSATLCSAFPLAYQKNTYGAFLVSLRYTELAAKLLRNLRGCSYLPDSLNKNSDQKGRCFYLAEEGRFELPLQVSPD